MGNAVVTWFMLVLIAWVAQEDAEYDVADLDLLEPTQLSLPGWIAAIYQVRLQQDLDCVMRTV